MDTRIFVCASISDTQGRFLLLKRSDTSRFAPGQWEFVSGSIDPGETAEECITREIFEETGLVVGALSSLPVFETTDSDGRWIVIPFKVQVAQSEIVLSDEHQEYSWFNRGEIEDLPYMHGMEMMWAE